MSMYSELLAAAMQAGSGGASEHRAPGELVAWLTSFRGRLAGEGDGAAAGAPAPVAGAADLALQMEYDLTLMQLCRLVGIEHGVERFDQPVLERRRLEAALGAEGIEIAVAPTRAVPG